MSEVSEINPYSVLVTDVDGVLTNGQFEYTKRGKVSKIFGPHDADAIKLYRSIGVKVLAVTADKRGFKISEKRCSDLSLPLTYVPALLRPDWINAQFKDVNVGYIGDGYHDIQVFRQVSVSYAPLNSNAQVVLNANGGNGVLMYAFQHFLEKHSYDKYQRYKRGDLSWM